MGRDGEQEGEVPPRQALVVAGRVAEDPVAGQPEPGDDVERDDVTDQLVSLLRQLDGEVGGRIRIGHLDRGRHCQLQDQQGEGDGHHVVGQGQ
jgi:hypothetical protein